MAANKVIKSIEAPGGQLCVDIFRRPDDSFGFELYRRDPEEGHGWYQVGYFADRQFETQATAEAAARDAVPWLKVV